MDGGDGPPGAWEPVWEGRGEIEARMVADGLRDAGIDAVPRGSYSPQFIAPMLTLSMWSVWVREEGVDDARAYFVDHDLEEGLLAADPPDDMASRARLVIGLMLLLALGVVAFGLWNAR